MIGGLRRGVRRRDFDRCSAGQCAKPAGILARQRATIGSVRQIRAAVSAWRIHEFYFCPPLPGLVLVFLVFKFKSGNPVNNGSLITGWWGILGLIGWGYMVAALLYTGARDNIIYTAVAWLFFLVLNILSKLQLLQFLNPVKPVFGVILEGNVPFIVISGLIVSLIMRKLSPDYRKIIISLLSFGVVCIIAGFFLRNWFIISKIKATPSWGLICNGISMIVFAFIYWIADVRKQTKWAAFLKPAGENSLTTYLAPDILYFLIFSLNFPVLIYKHSSIPMVVIAGSIAWAMLMVGLTALLVKVNIRLKL